MRREKMIERDAEREREAEKVRSGGREVSKDRGALSGLEMRGETTETERSRSPST